MRMHYYIFALAFSLLDAVKASDDPVRDYVLSFSSLSGDRSIFSDDQLLRLDLDLNNDGTKEVLLSMSRNRNGKQGNVWRIFSRKPSGYSEVDTIIFSSSRFHLGTLPNGEYGIASFGPSGAGEGVMWGYVFDGSRINQIKLGEVVLNRQTMELEGAEIIDMLLGQDAISGDEAVGVISAEKLGDTYGVSVESKTYQEALQEGLPGSVPIEVRSSQHQSSDDPQVPSDKQPSALKKPTPLTLGEEPASATPWSVIVVLIVAATGLLWLLMKIRK